MNGGTSKGTCGLKCFRSRESMDVKVMTLEGEIVENSNVSLSSILSKNEKVEHHIRMKDL